MESMSSLVFFEMGSYNNLRVAAQYFGQDFASICFGRSMDRTTVSGTVDTGSIPVRSAKSKKPFLRRSDSPRSPSGSCGTPAEKWFFLLFSGTGSSCENRKFHANNLGKKQPRSGAEKSAGKTKKILLKCMQICTHYHRDTLIAVHFLLRIAQML